MWPQPRPGLASQTPAVLEEAMERGSLELVLGRWFPEPSPPHDVSAESLSLEQDSCARRGQGQGWTRIPLYADERVTHAGLNDTAPN
jgi:hypothetical protein